MTTLKDIYLNGREYAMLDMMRKDVDWLSRSEKIGYIEGVKAILEFQGYPKSRILAIESKFRSGFGI